MIAGQRDEKVTSNNYKQYDETLVEKVNWIVEAKKADLTLAEIKNLLENWFNKKLTADKKIDLVEKKIKEVDTKIDQLKDVKRFLLQAKSDVENGLC